MVSVIEEGYDNQAVKVVSGVSRELMTDGLRSPSFEFAPFLTLARPLECVGFGQSA